MSNPPKIVRVNDPASAFTLVAIAASILLLYSLSRIISLQRRVRDLESRPPVDDIVMRGMIRQQINDTFQTYEKRRSAELMEAKAIEAKAIEAKAIEAKSKEQKNLPKTVEPKEEPKEVEPNEVDTKDVKQVAHEEIEIKRADVEKEDEYIADNEEAKIATKTIRKRSTKPKASV
jgi:hypothetical protein